MASNPPRVPIVGALTMAHCNTIAPIAAEFQTEMGAREWRAEQGGWIFASDCGRFIWFNLSHTASRVFRSPLARGMNGRLI
jgi:hypothetical protein